MRQSPQSTSTAVEEGPASAGASSELQFAEIGPEDSRHDQRWEAKPSPGSNFAPVNLQLDGATHEVWIADKTDSRPAIVYAEHRTLRALALASYRAQGESDAAAIELADRVSGFVYHGGEPSLDAQGFPRNAVVLDKAPEGRTRAEALAWGAVIKHELTHATERQGELPAHLAQQEYLLRNGAVIRRLSPEQLETHIREKGLEPSISIPADEVISPSIGPIGGSRGVNSTYYPRPQQISADQIARNRLEAERRYAEERRAQLLADQREQDRVRAHEAFQRAAQSQREQWLQSNLPGALAAVIVPVSRFIFGPPEVSSSERTVEGVSGGGISGGLGQGRGGQGQHQQQQQRRRQEDPSAPENQNIDTRG